MGFQAPNHTQVPNDFFEMWLPKLKLVETRLLLAIFRRTFGWRKTIDRISLTQLMKATGSIKRHLIDAAKSLEKKGLIRKMVIGPEGDQNTYYELVIDDPKESSSDYKNNNSNSKECYTGVNLTPPPGVNLTPTKERFSKERNPKAIHSTQVPVFTKKRVDVQKKRIDGGSAPKPPPASFVPKDGKEEGMEEKIKRTVIPKEDRSGILEYYNANRSEIDSKRNPVGWLVKMYKLGKHKGAERAKSNVEFAKEICSKHKLSARSDGKKLYLSGMGAAEPLYFSDCSFREQLLSYVRKDEPVPDIGIEPFVR